MVIKKVLFSNNLHASDYTSTTSFVCLFDLDTHSDFIAVAP